MKTDLVSSFLNHFKPCDPRSGAQSLALLNELGAGRGREDLTLATAHRAQVQHHEVLLFVAQGSAHLLPVPRLLEVVQLL